MEISTTKGCRCGSSTWKRTKASASVYKTQWMLQVPWKVWRGRLSWQARKAKATGQYSQRRKRKQHVYQQHRRGSSSLKFPKFKGKAINGGPFNQLEHTLLCPITLIMEQTNQQLSSINAFKMFNDIVSKVDEFSFTDPASRSLCSFWDPDQYHALLRIYCAMWCS